MQSLRPAPLAKTLPPVCEEKTYSQGLAIIIAILFAVCSSNAKADVIVVDQAGAAPKQEDVDWSDQDSSDDNACTVAFAASELQKYLRLITERHDDWRIVGLEDSAVGNSIILRKSESKELQRELGNQGYLLEAKPADGGWTIEITAPNRVGVLYGVYGLLDILGVRWFAPGDGGEVVPHAVLDTITAFRTTEKPDFLIRGFHAWQDRADDDFLLWMARNRLNFWCLEQSNKPLINKLGIQLIGGEHLLHCWYLGSKSRYPYDHARFEGDDSLPADPYAESPSYQGDADGNEELSYYEAHPEWYGMYQGKRIPGPSRDEERCRHGHNFCTSNKDALAEFTKNAIQDLIDGRMGEASMVNAWLLDNAKWCECEQCAKLGSPTDRNLLVIHAYDQAIKEARRQGKINRDVRLLFLTYNDVIDPPTRPLPQDFDYDTCIATFFPIRRCYVHELQDHGCDINVRFSGILDRWISDPDRYYRGQMCIGEYYNVSRFMCLPICFMDTMKTDIPYYYRLGGRYFHYMHVSTENWGNKALTNWQMARQLWDADTDVEKLWQDYFAGRYGPVADPMRRYYKSLENMLANITGYKYLVAPALNRGDQDPFSGSNHLSYRNAEDNPATAPSLHEMREAGQECRAIIDKVLQQNLPERVRNSVLEDERMLRYGELTLEYYDLGVQGFAAVQANDLESAKSILAKLKTVAEKLKLDTNSASCAGEHASSPNALIATYAPDMVEKLSMLIDRSEPTH